MTLAIDSSAVKIRDTLSPNGSGTKGYDPYGSAQGNPATLTDPSGHSLLATCVVCLPVSVAAIAYYAAWHAGLAIAWV